MKQYSIFDTQRELVENIEAETYQQAMNTSIMAGLKPSTDYLVIESQLDTENAAEILYIQVRDLLEGIIDRDVEIMNAEMHNGELWQNRDAAIETIKPIDSPKKAAKLAVIEREYNITKWATDSNISRWLDEAKGMAIKLYESVIGSILEGQEFQFTGRKQQEIKARSGSHGIQYYCTKREEWVKIEAPVEF